MKTTSYRMFSQHTGVAIPRDGTIKSVLGSNRCNGKWLTSAFVSTRLVSHVWYRRPNDLKSADVDIFRNYRKVAAIFVFLPHRSNAVSVPVGWHDNTAKTHHRCTTGFSFGVHYSLHCILILYKLIRDLVISRVDYCNSVLAGISGRLLARL